MDQIVAAIMGLRNDVVAIVNHIKAVDQVRKDDQEYLIKTISEQKETNRILMEKIKSLEETVIELQLFGDKK